MPPQAQVLNLVASQEKDPKSLEELTNLPNCAISGQRGSILPKMVVVCVIGGLTYAEIAACRLVEKSNGIRLVLASDSIATGNNMLEKVQEI